ncbi:MAG: hypothetical protein HY752_01595 [Nitrospirae bacterium]|nr:hypothetical protein [Nitrospirota bacterium]
MKKDELFLKRIKAELLSEPSQVSRLMDEYRGFLRKYSNLADPYILRVKASFIADFYTGVEKIFRTITEELNGGTPRGEGWHKRLLHTMMLEAKGIRPAVISKELYLDLSKFLGFRHVVRQAYGFQLDKKKIEELEKIFGKTCKKFFREIKKFCNFLEGK